MGQLGRDNKVPFNHLIKECVLAGEWAKASEAIKRMLHQGRGGKGIRFDHNTFNAVSTVSWRFESNRFGFFWGGQV